MDVPGAPGGQHDGDLRSICMAVFAQESKHQQEWHAEAQKRVQESKETALGELRKEHRVGVARLVQLPALQTDMPWEELAQTSAEEGEAREDSGGGLIVFQTHGGGLEFSLGKNANAESPSQGP